MSHQCMVCPVEVRNLLACANNLMTAYDNGAGERIAKKLYELRDAVKRMEPVVDEHFAALRARERSDHELEELAEILHRVDCSCRHGLPCHRGDTREEYLEKAEKFRLMCRWIEVHDEVL